MPTIEVKYEQFAHRDQASETHTTTYESYEEVITATRAYFEGRCGRFPNEVFDVQLRAANWHDDREYMVPSLNSLTETLSIIRERVLVNGNVCKVYLTLDGTTNWGRPYLQCVTISIPTLVEEVREAARAKRLATIGLCEGCGNPDCDHDCGVLLCGCIDTCRGLCGTDLEDRYY